MLNAPEWLEDVLRENWGYLPVIHKQMDRYIDREMADLRDMQPEEAIPKLEGILIGCWLQDGRAKPDDQEGWGKMIDEYYRKDKTVYKLGLMHAIAMYKVRRYAPMLFPEGVVPGAAEVYRGAPGE